MMTPPEDDRPSGRELGPAARMITNITAVVFLACVLILMIGLTLWALIALFD